LLTYKDIFDALATGNWEVAHSLSSSMGNWGERDREMVHPFDFAFGNTLKYFVLDDLPEMMEWTPRFAQVCRETRSEDFLGYADVFESLIRRDVTAAQGGFNTLIAGHKKQSKGKGVFALNADQMLCVWGIGLANLCRRRGLMVIGVPPLIPNELLI
jgi:hypothetical protein